MLFAFFYFYNFFKENFWKLIEYDLWHLKEMQLFYYLKTVTSFDIWGIWRKIGKWVSGPGLKVCGHVWV